MPKPDVEVVKRGAIAKLEGLVSRPIAALKKIGALLVSRAVKAFSMQSRFDEDWDERLVPNWPGIISDLDRGASIKERRFKPRPAVIDTGRLRQSIAWQLESEEVVKVGTNVPYASTQHFGGESVVQVTDKAKVGLKKWLGTPKGSQWRPQLQWLLSVGSEAKLDVLPRPFIGVDSQDALDIRAILQTHLFRLEGPRGA